MQIIQGKTGWIEVICGPMFSGKSEELIRRLRRAEIARLRVQIFKHAIDKRYDATNIVSHSAQSLPSIAISDAETILQLVDDRTEVIAIDEGQFFGPEIAEVCSRLANLGKRIIVAGLDLDYLGQPFGPMPEMMCRAEYVTKQLAICMSCGNPAGFTQRLTTARDQIVVGAQGTYEARCRQHFEVPDRSSIDEPDDSPAEAGTA